MDTLLDPKTDVTRAEAARADARARVHLARGQLEPAVGTLNEIIGVLTIFAEFFIPLTFMVGTYGTAFKYQPQPSYRYSYFILWGVMIVVAVGMLLYFRRRKWL